MNNTLTYVISQKLLFLPKFPYLITLKFFLILSVTLIISLLAFYIFQITTVISEGYQIQNYQKRLSELSQENKILEINSIKINSLENIDNKIQELGFEKMNNVHYIQILESSVVTTK